jgi:hypothetical protein
VLIRRSFCLVEEGLSHQGEHRAPETPHLPDSRRHASVRLLEWRDSGTRLNRFRPVRDQSEVPLHGSLGSPADVQIGFVSRSFLEDRIPIELARWARRNDCGPKPTLSKVATGITLIAYQCPDHDTVELYREDGDGHTWPGSALTNLPAVRATLGRTTFAIDADHLIWAFFQSHQLPR